MINKIDHLACRKAYPNFPWRDNRTDEYFHPESFAFHKLILQSKTAKGHAGNLARNSTILLREMKMQRLIFLGDTRVPWRYQDNPYKPVQDALLYLKQNKISKRFDGALDVSQDEWLVFLKHLFWLVRCNAVLPIIFFMDPRQSILGSICKYGNIHLNLLTPETDAAFQRALTKTAFSILTASHCYSSFSETSKNQMT